MATKIVTYEGGDGTSVRFEVEPAEGFQPAAPGQVVGRISEAVEPVIEAAKVVLAKAKDARPDNVELKFGIKVSGGANWFVAKSSAEGNFEVTLTWARAPESRA